MVAAWISGNGHSFFGPVTERSVTLSSPKTVPLTRQAFCHARAVLGLSGAL